MSMNKYNLTETTAEINYRIIITRTERTSFRDPECRFCLTPNEEIK